MKTTRIESNRTFPLWNYSRKSFVFCQEQGFTFLPKYQRSTSSGNETIRLENRLDLSSTFRLSGGVAGKPDEAVDDGVGWFLRVALEALRKAFVLRRPKAGLIHHSDRGSQYGSIDYQAELRRHGVLISMSGKGNCYDKAMVETFFKTLKSERVWRTIFQTRTEAKVAIGRYIDSFYNPVRRHSALDFISPVQFERLAAA